MSHRDILESRLSEAHDAYLASSSEAKRLHDELKAAQGSIDSLQARYEKSCRGIAEGDPKAEDPGALLAQRDRESHRVRGLQVLHREANDADQRAAATVQAASIAMQAQIDAEELERLEAAIAQSKEKVEAAQAALSDAEKANRTAVVARSKFLRQLELKAKGAA